MSPSTVDASAKERLRALNPDIPMLASQAAIELDNLLQRGSKQLNAVTKLAQLLSNSVARDHSPGSARALMDPGTVAVMARVGKSVGAHSVNTLDDLVEYASTVATGLKGVGTGHEQPPSSVEGLRDFCVALSNCALAYVQSIRDLRPAHPYRR